MPLSSSLSLLALSVINVTARFCKIKVERFLEYSKMNIFKEYYHSQIFCMSEKGKNPKEMLQTNNEMDFQNMRDTKN